MVVDRLCKAHRQILIDYLEQQSSLCILLLDQDFRLMDCNSGFLRLVGEDLAQEGAALLDCLPEESKKGLFHLLEGGIAGGVRLSVRGKESSLYTVDAYCYPLGDAHLVFWEIKALSRSEIIEEFSVLNNELTNIVRELNKKNHELKKANDTINRLLRVDPLTELYNRRFFMESLEKSISLFHRHRFPFSLVMADLDNFKAVNDCWGHGTGDRVLIAFSRLLQDVSREEDIPARIGGEEFIVLLQNTVCEEALHYAERVREAWGKEQVPPVDMPLTSSFGVTSFYENDTADSVISRVDRALYRAKAKGKNRVEGIRQEEVEA